MADPDQLAAALLHHSAAFVRTRPVGNCNVHRWPYDCQKSRADSDHVLDSDDAA